METNLQSIILQKLINDEQYCRKVIPFVKAQYFEGSHKEVYKLVLDFITKYNKLPTKTAIGIELNASEISEELYPGACALVESLGDNPAVEEKWLLEQTEKWCKDRALYQAIVTACAIIDGKKKDVGVGAIPDILQKALAISFDSSVGHNYIADSDERYDFYHRLEERIPFDLAKFNVITRGGVPKKTLNVVMAGTGVGKSLFLCHLAASYLAQGKNVLYITLELAEERVAERIDANLMNVPMDMIAGLSKADFDGKIAKISANTVGKLIIKEYPTASAHAGHFRALLNELLMKLNFVPDAIMVDYLNICASARVSGLSSSVNSYSLAKCIAEELRGLAVEFNVPVWTATQTNRAGLNNSDVELTETSESVGLPFTADFFIALMVTEELGKLGQILVKQLKSRYGDIMINTRFVIGVDRNRMKLFDVEESAQTMARETAVKKSNFPMPTGGITKNSEKFSEFQIG